MEKQRICKICNRRFSNGKAMGGHMRSHLAKLHLPPKPQSPPQQQHHQLSDSLESLSPPFSTSNRAMHSSLDLGVVHDGGDSDSESHPRNPTHRRSKRRRKMIGKSSLTLPFEAEQVSSVTDAFSTEDVAMCLIMLSMDKWEKVKVKNGVDESADEEEEDESNDHSGSGFRSHAQVQTRRKYKCETCDKVFRSYHSNQWSPAQGQGKGTHQYQNPNQVNPSPPSPNFQQPRNLNQWNNPNQGYPQLGNRNQWTPDSAQFV